MTETPSLHTFYMIADNEPGVLARVTALFSARGYQIQGLTAGEVDEAAHLSCMTITTIGTAPVIAQIKAQLEKIIAIRSVVNLTQSPAAVERELILARIERVTANFDKMVEALKVLDARQVSADADSVTYELSGPTRAINQHIAQLHKIGAVDISRSGIVGIAAQMPAVTAVA